MILGRKQCCPPEECESNWKDEMYVKIMLSYCRLVAEMQSCSQMKSQWQDKTTSLHLTCLLGHHGAKQEESVPNFLQREGLVLKNAP